mgnify:CR=1 FL=1
MNEILFLLVFHLLLFISFGLNENGEDSLIINEQLKELINNSNNNGECLKVTNSSEILNEKYSYEASPILNNYIVTWTGYFYSQTHPKLLKSILGDTTCNSTINDNDNNDYNVKLKQDQYDPESCWKVVPRQNLATKFPSDFTLISLYGSQEYLEKVTQLLTESQLVKRITPQKRVIRTLLHIEPPHYNFPRRTTQILENEDMIGPTQPQITNLFEADILWKKGCFFFFFHKI